MGRTALLLAVLLGLLALLAPRPGQAHAVLLGTEPAADSVVAAAPGRIELRFNEPVRPVVLRVIDLQGAVRAEEGAARVIDDRIELPLPEGLSPGGYIVTWRAVSADSHPVGGSFRFAVGGAPGDWQAGVGQAGVGPMPSTQALWFWTIGLAAARSLFLAGLLLAAGGAWFRLLLAGRTAALTAPANRAIVLPALVGGAAALAGVGLQGGHLLGAPPLALLETATWATGLSVPLGQAMLASAVLLAALAALALILPQGQRWRQGRAAALPVAVLALLAVLPLAWAGHVAMARPQWLTAPSLALHVGVAAFWFGALPALLRAVRHLPAEQAALLLARFSSLAVWAVALLVLAGTVMGAVQMGGISPFWTTAYGALLAGKLALVALLLLLALYNKARLTPALAAGRPSAAAALGRAIRAEIGLIVLVLVLTALLGFSTPPRALRAPAAPEAMQTPTMQEGHAHHHGAHDHGVHHHGTHHHGLRDNPIIERRATVRGTTVLLQLSPGRAGSNRLTVFVEDVGGNPLQVLEVQALFASSEHGIEAVSRRLEPADGHFVLDTGDMALPGAWQVRIDVLVTDFDKPIFGFELDIPR